LASHASSAWLWGIGVASTEWVDVIFADRNRRVRLPGVRTHTPTDVDDLRPLRRSGIPTTNPLRVLVDLGQVQPDAVGDTLRHFLVEGVVSRSAVRASLGRHGRKGRHGVRVLRAAFEQWAIDDKPPDSELERVMAQLLGGHQLPLAEFHAHILGFEVDFALAVGRVIVECDGWDAHGRNPVQFERDRRRDAELVAAGWVVLRFTWLQITRRPAWVADVLRRTLRARPAA